MYRWPIEKTRLFEGDNPAHGLDLFPERSRERFLKRAELEPFFSALRDEPNELLRDFFLLGLLTGVRRSNLLAMRWIDVDVEAAEWRIPVTKNGDPQAVTLAPGAVAVLRNRRVITPEKCPWVFPSSKSKSEHIVEPKSAWKRVLARSRLTDLRIHDLRRTLGRWQAGTGASLVIVGKTLNHKSPQSTQLYARLDLDPVGQSVDRATAAMFEAAGLQAPAEIAPISQAANPTAAG
jgi:integrase